MSGPATVERSLAVSRTGLPKHDDPFEKLMQGISPQRARDVLLDPGRMSRFISWVSRKFSDGREDCDAAKSWIISGRLLDKVQHNNDLLKRIFSIYEDASRPYEFLAADTLAKIKADDTFFKKAYDQGKKNGHYYSMRTALGRITDEEFKCNVIIKALTNYNQSKDTPEYLAARDAIPSLKNPSIRQEVTQAAGQIRNKGERGLVMSMIRGRTP